MNRRRLLFILLLIAVIFLAVGAYFFLKKRSNPNELILYGNVDVRQVDLGFRANGRVVSMPYEEGDLVQPGSFMARLDTQPYEDQVRQAAATVDATKVSLHYAEQVFKRRQELIKDGSVSKEDYENALSNRDVLQANLKQAEASLGVALTNLRDTEIFAPTEGVILTRIREPGTVVREADPVYTLSIISPVWIRAYVPEPGLGLVYPGMTAEVFTDTKGAPSYIGHVGFISPVAEFTPKTVETTQLRTDLVYRLRIYIEQPDRFLRQGMPVTVKLRIDSSSKDGKKNP